MRGSEGSIFQLTKSTCAGYKLGIIIYVVDERLVLMQLQGNKFLLWLASNIWWLVPSDTKDHGNM